MKNRFSFCFFITLVLSVKCVSQENSVSFCLKYYIFDRYPSKIYNLEDINKEIYVQDDMCNNDIHLMGDNYKWFIDTIRLSPMDAFSDRKDQFERIMLMLMLEDQARNSLITSDLKISDFFQLPFYIESGKYANMTSYGTNGSLVYFQKSKINTDFSLSDINIIVSQTEISGLFKYKIELKNMQLFEFLISGFFIDKPLNNLVLNKD